MKKILLGLMSVMLLAMAAVCTSCKGCTKSESPKIDDPVALVYHDYDGVAQDFTAGTAHVQALHRQTMNALTEGADFEWRNSRVVLSDTLGFDNIDQLRVTDVIDVFQYWNEQGPWVQYIASNAVKGVQIPWPINDIWIEDANLSDKPVKLSAEDALARLKQWNGVLPNGCNFITLRLPIGPKDCNPQWVIGGVYDPLFIDAVTGEITDSNPAFKPQK